MLEHQISIFSMETDGEFAIVEAKKGVIVCFC